MTRTGTGTHINDLNIESGSISALGINVSLFYKLGKQSDSKIKKESGSLILLDIQYLGNQELPSFMEMLKTPRINSLYLSSDSHIDKVICANKSNPAKRTPKKSTDDGVLQFIQQTLQPDNLSHYYTDYDSMVDALVTREVYAGSVIKMRRLPVISIYKNKKAIEFMQVISDKFGISLSRENTKNFIVYSETMKESSPKMYIIGTPEHLEYQHSYIIDPSDMKLKKVTSESTLTAYKKHQKTELVINACDISGLIQEAISSS